MGAIQYVSSSTAVFFSGSQGSTFYQVEYLIIGGGGGGFQSGGGGGGYVSAVTGETGSFCRNAGSGSGNNYVPTGKFLQVQTAVDYNIQIGAGGAPFIKGGNSYVDTIVAIGGGGGLHLNTFYFRNNYGGSGGGGGIASGDHALMQNLFTARQGNSGFSSTSTKGGGGGAGGPATSTAGGAGMSSSISGSAVTYAAGGNATANGNGTANTGNGADSTTANQSGGSGIIILKYPSSLTISVTNSNVTATGYTYATGSSFGDNLYDVTITGTNHGLVAGEPITLDFTSGGLSTTSRDGTYTVSHVIGANSFVVTLEHVGGTGATGSVNVTQPTIAVSTTTSGNSKISTFTAGFGTFQFN